MPAINCYHIYGDRIELWTPGAVLTIPQGEEMENIKSWINDAKRWAAKDSTFNTQICNYIEYMWEEVYGF